jgi:hypothetical protein
LDKIFICFEVVYVERFESELDVPISSIWKGSSKAYEEFVSKLVVSIKKVWI